MSRTNGRPSMEIEFDPRWGLVTFAYLAGIYWLSSLPDSRPPDGSEIVQTLLNLLHIPVYAGLAFCFLRAISGGRGERAASWQLSALAFVATSAYAALDEWHQSFVPGRYALFGDFLMDLLGSGGMLLILHWKRRFYGGS